MKRNTHPAVGAAKRWRPGITGRLAVALAVGLTGSHLIANAAVIRVTTTGNDAHSGLQWGVSKRTVTAALAAGRPGDEIWVAAGIYTERINLKNGVALYGGFLGNETAREQRNWRALASVLDGNQQGAVVRCEVAGATATTRLDGFTVRNGRGVMGGGIVCVATSPTIANNLVTRNTSVGEGGGICCYNGANPLIIGNVITENHATTDDGNGGGICCMKGKGKGNVGSSPSIVGNIIARNDASRNGGGICAKGVFVSDDGQVVIASSPTILNNFITENFCCISDRGVGGGGIACIEDGTLTVAANNTITANAGLQAGGILLLVGARDNPALVNNTLVGNSGPAIRWGGAHTIRIANNLVAFNSTGLSLWIESPGGTRMIAHNCVYGNRVDYDGLNDLTGAGGNFSLDPRLAGVRYGDSHLQPDSPCIGAGDATWIEAGWVDMDGQPRLLGGLVDVGADESDGNPRNVTPRIIHVSPTGNDNQTGASWATAKRTVKAAIDAIHLPALGEHHTLHGGEVWVRAGSYQERDLLLPPYVWLQGGFAGNEIHADQRDWEAHRTTLDAGGTGRVVLAVSGYQLSEVSGFVLQNARIVSELTDQGGAVECFLAGPFIRHNLIQNNHANLGAAVGGYGATATVRDNLIQNNTAGADGRGLGGAIHFDRSLPVIEDNTFTGNAAADGAAIFTSFSKPWIVDNEIYDNTGNGITCQNTRGLSWVISLELLIGNNLVSGHQTAGQGGGISLLLCAGNVVNNLIVGNRSGTLAGGGFGGGMAITAGDENDGPLVVANNSILGNTAEYFGLAKGGGVLVHLLKTPNLRLINNIVAYNNTGIYNESTSPVSPVMDRNNFFSNGGMNYQVFDTFGIAGGPLVHPTDLAADPRFVSLQGDFHLQPGSPCIDAGSTEGAPAVDLDGRPRPLDGDANGAAAPDLGAYEYSHPSAHGVLRLVNDHVEVDRRSEEAAVRVLRTDGISGAVSVHYATTDGTARAGVDYVATSGTLAFNDAVAVGVIRIPLLGKGSVSNPAFTLRLSGPTGSAALGTPNQARITLTGPVINNPWGIPQSWLDQYGLSNVTETSDADGDGFFDRYEYFAGTNPKEAGSLLRIESAAHASGGDVVLKWTSVGGKRYTIRRADHLPTGMSFGEAVQTDIAATPPRNTLTLDQGPGAGPWFYVVEVEP